MTGKHIKSCSIKTLVIGECQLKLLQVTIVHLQWLKEKVLTISSADKDAEQLELSRITHVNAKWQSHCGQWFASFF